MSEEKECAARRVMAVINNLILGLLADSDFPFVHAARCYYAAHPQAALELLI